MAVYPDRKNGKLTGRFRVEVSRAGKRLRGRADTMREAKALERQYQAALEGNEPPAPKPLRDPTPPQAPQPIAPLAHPCLTLGEASDKAKGVLWSGQATEAYSLLKLDRIVTLLGRDLPMNDIDTVVAYRVVQLLKDGERSAATINRYLSCLSAFLRFAKRRGYRTCDLPELEWGKETETRIRWITPSEEAALLKALPEPYSTVAHIAIRQACVQARYCR